MKDNVLGSEKTSLTVCLDARLQNGLSGGVQQFVIGLASGLDRLTDGDEKFVLLCYSDSYQWLKEHLQGRCEIILTNASVPLRQKIEQIVGHLPFGTALLKNLVKLLGNPLLKLPDSDPALERVGAEVMHFTHQSAFRTAIPSIYHPWDLQHIHFPEFFTEHQRKTRDFKYREFCYQARIVSVGSDWMKNEVVNHFDLDPQKVKVMPMAPPVDAYSIPTDRELEETRSKLSLAEPFIFYPAQTWAHKNHLVLIRALALLREKRNIRPILVCSGNKNDYFPVINKELKKLNMTSQVRFLGFISPMDIQCLYRLCRLMVFPSKYEGWGLPVTEALRIGVPTACSRLKIFLEQAGDAALYFDPDNPNELADTISRLWEDAELRKKLALVGKRNSARFSWDKTARLFRACYRLLGGQSLKEEDQLLLLET